MEAHLVKKGEAVILGRPLDFLLDPPITLTVYIIGRRKEEYDLLPDASNASWHSCDGIHVVAIDGN